MTHLLYSPKKHYHVPSQLEKLHTGQNPMPRFFIAFHMMLLVLVWSSTSHAFPPTQSPNFLVLSDIHVDTHTPLTMDISPSSPSVFNDLDEATFKQLIQQLAVQIKTATVANPKFILVLGDLAGHARLFPNSAEHNESLVFQVLKQTFPNTPILYTFGNNDSLKTNYGPFTDATNQNLDKSPYDIAKSHGGWQNGFLSTGTLCRPQKTTRPCLIDENTVDGYYAAYLAKGLRLLSLNSVLFSPKRTGVTQESATQQLHWLAAQLKTAQTQHESVLIALHIPPGNNVYDNTPFWLPNEQQTFLELINTYSNTIIGLLAGHTHAEELKIIKRASGKPITGVYFTAALSTSHGNEPSVKTFYLTKRSKHWQLSDYETFHFVGPQTALVFKKLYQYQSYYCPRFSKNPLACLNQITAAKMKRYFTAGNANYVGTINAPDAMVLTIPKI